MLGVKHLIETHAGEILAGMVGFKIWLRVRSPSRQTTPSFGEGAIDSRRHRA
jgi:hypothetical protein